MSSNTRSPPCSWTERSSSTWAGIRCTWNGRRAIHLDTSASTRKALDCFSPATTSCPSSHRTSGCILRAHPIRCTTTSRASSAWLTASRNSSCLRTDARSRMSPLESMLWSRTITGGWTRSRRSWAGTRRRRGRSRSSCGVRATTSTRRGLRSRKGWRTCRLLRSTGACANLSRPSSCAGSSLDPEREEVSRVATDPDDTRPRVCPDDRTKRLDHQGLGHRLQLAGHALSVLLRVGVSDHHAQSLAPIDLARQVDHPIQGAVESAHALEWGDEPVAYAEHRFHLQHRAEQRVRATDASTASQEFEGGHREVRLHLVTHCANALHHRFSARAPSGELGCREREQSE